MRWKVAWLGLVVMVLGAYALFWIRDGIPFLSKWRGEKTIAERIVETQRAFNTDLAPALKAAGIEGLPNAVALLFLKDKKVLDLYAGINDGNLHFVKQYSVKAASGHEGPKLKEGDRQVPEGIYRIEWLNPNSAYYLSMKVSYPNAVDAQQAQSEGRTDLGGDIMIHGSRVSIGCIAIGDESIAELFHLAAVTEFQKWKLLLAPNDLRVTAPPAEVIAKFPWMTQIYAQLKSEMLALEAK